jgi:hypothetical protein
MGGIMPAALKERKTSIKSRSSISEEELAQRVAVIKRFKELLIQQRERFRSYLAVLDRQQLLIGYGSADEITAHVELEEQIVADIFSIQKVIAPLEIMYNAVSNATGAATGAADNAACADPDDLNNLGSFITINDVPEIQAALEDLKNQAVVRSVRNRDLLSRRMEEINTDIQTIKNNPFLSKARNALYQNVSPSLVDVMG